MASSGRQMGPGCMVVFSLPFAGVGVGMLIWMAFTFTTYLGMRSWQGAQARILSADLVSSTSSSSDGGSSTSYKATATYTYTFDGKEYTSNRVTAQSGSDSVGNFQKRAHQELKEYVKSKELYSCYVNPADPSEAVLYRGLRIEMLGFQALFGLVFGGVGFGLMIYGIRSLRTRKAATELTASNPEEPWLWRQEWADGRIRSGTKVGMIGTIVFAVIWNAISCPILFVLPGEVSKGNHLALIGLIFPLVGLGMVIAAVYQIMKWMKYGESVFEMTTVPGALGGPLEGIIRTKVNIRPEEGFRLQLSCLNRVITGSGKNRSSSERILWQDSRTIKHELLERDFSQSAIPVRFAIPYDLKHSSTEHTDSDIVWRLEVTADVPGVDYSAKFEVPVFRTDESSEDYEPEEAFADADNEATDLSVDLRREGVVMRRTAGGFQVHFPMLRNKKAACAAIAFWIIWTGFIVLMLSFKTPILFPILFGLFDLLIFYFMVHTIFHTSRIEVRHGRLEVSGGILGIGPTHRLQASQVAALNTKKTMQSGNTLYYKIELKTSQGKKISVGSSIGNQQLVKKLVAEMERCLAE